MFTITMLFNHVRGIVSLFNLENLKCFDLPKSPKPRGEAGRCYEHLRDREESR